MISIGIDPSLTRTAVARIDDDRTILLHDRPTSGQAGAPLSARLTRLLGIVDWTQELFENGAPVLWTIEGPSMNQRNAASAHDRSGLWWLITNVLVGFGYGLPVIVEPKVRAKYATGKGNAGKDEVLAAVVRRYPQAPVANNDQADALILAAIGARLAGKPVENELPKTHLAALDKIKLPTPAVAA